MLHHERGMSLVSLVFVPQLCSSLCPCSVGPLGQRKIRSGFAEAAVQGRAGQGRRPLCCSGRERTFIISSTQCSAQDFVQRHLGGSKLSREGWICTRDYTGGSEIHQKQANNPMDTTAKKSQCSASAMMGKVEETKARKGKTQKGIWEEDINSCSKQHIQFSHRGRYYRGQGALSERQVGAMK